MTLFTLGGDSTYLLQMLTAVDTSGTTRWLSSVRLLHAKEQHWGPGSSGTPSLSWLEGPGALTTCLDPAGRVVATYTRSGKLYSRTLATTTALASTWGPEKII